MHNSALFSFILSASTFLSYSTLAACTASPDCATLGYDKTSCPSGDDVLKCPFDTTKLKCIPLTCETIGKRTCGDNCVPTTYDGCCVGDIYYSDKSCSANLVSGKTPIGVVGYITNGGKNGVVVALDTAYDDKSNNGRQWGCYGTDLSLTNYSDQTSAQTDFSGKTNTDVIVSQCGSGTAAYYCKNTYSKGGVSGWYLPAYGELYAILYTNFNTVNTGLGKISSNNQITFGYWYWCSSEYSSTNALVLRSGSTDWNRYSSKKASDGKVRCALAF